jgi:predicted RNase H-like nuclease (RuvC/YqgF family)
MTFGVALSATAYPQTPGNGVELEYHDNRVSLKADKVDIKTILLRISTATGIYVKFPRGLEKEITIDIKNMPLAKALKKLLRGINHIVIYSEQKKSHAVTVSKVFVYDQAKGSYTSGGARVSSVREKRIANQIESYKKRIERLTQRLNSVDASSSLGQRYTRQIESYKKTIERLEQSIR